MKYNSKSQNKNAEKSVPKSNGFAENFCEKHFKKLLYGVTGLAFLMSMLLFNPDVSVGGDDSTYLESAYKFAHGQAFPDWHGPFYPIFLSFFYMIFGFKIILFKMISVLFYTFSVFFTYKLFAKTANYFAAFVMSLFSAFSLMLLLYASTTYSEPMFMFMQSLLLYLYFDFNEKEPLWQQSDSKKIFIAYSALAVLAYLTFQTRSVAVAIVPAIFVLLLIDKKKKPAFVFLGATTVFHLLVTLYRKTVWHTASVSFMEQLDANFLVNPYKPQYGYETLGGFVQRFWDNCTLYLSKHLMKLFGFKDYDSRQYSVYLTILIIAVFLLCGFYIYKKNKKLFTVFGYVIVMVGVTFVMVQKLWDQERLIMIYFPMIAGLLVYSLNEGLKWKNSLVSKLFALIVFCAIMKQTLVRGNFDLSDNFAVGTYSTYTDDWANYMKASKWAGENLPEGSVVACRKSQMSWMASEGTKRVKFYGIYKLYSSNADSMQHYLLDTVKATHVIMANLRLNPYELNGKTITTIRYSLRNLTHKYPYSLKLIKQFGDKEPAYLFEFTDFKKVDVDNLFCSVIVNPENINAWIQLGILYLNAGDNDKVISSMNEALRFNPNQYQFPYYQAFAYNNKGDKTNALKKIDEALKLNSEDPEVFYNKAVLLYETEKFQEALQPLIEARKLNYNLESVNILEKEINRHLK
ncbi:MAG: glycosyltransferase family 39 protein [Bacteroidales bacterium]|nr:glycosyltransferase family 39 protein [Bacteroidales bacterium]